MVISDYDCDYTGSSSIVIALMILSSIGIALIFVSSREFRSSAKGFLIFYLIIFFVQAAALLHASFFDTGLNCPDHTKGTDSFDYILPGMTEAEVVRRVGRPKSIQGCIWDFIVNEDPACERSYLYSSSLPLPLTSYTIVVWFNKEGRVIKVYKYHSP
jgi:hypothetical protein